MAKARRKPTKYVTLTVDGPGGHQVVKIPLDKPTMEAAIGIKPFIVGLPDMVVDAIAEAATWARVSRSA